MARALSPITVKAPHGTARIMVMAPSLDLPNTPANLIISLK